MITNEQLQDFANALADKAHAKCPGVYIEVSHTLTGHIMVSMHYGGDVEMYAIDHISLTWMRHYGPWQ